MGTNAAFGRPPARERLRDWWYAKSRTTRSNILITLVVGAVVVALVRAATSGDAERTGGRVNATRPSVTVVTPTTSTTLAGSLFAAADPSTPADLVGLSSTTSSTTAVAPPVTAAPSARSVTPSTTPATATAPATIVPTQDVIYTEVPAPVTTVPVTRSSVATTAPPTTATPTTPPPTTVPRAASTPTTAARLGLPPLIGTG